MNDAAVMNYQASLAWAIRMYLSKAVRACLLKGPPGGGKTAMAQYIAAAVGNRHIWPMKMAHHEVVDYAGVPVPIDDIQRTVFYPSGDMLPPTDKPYLVLIDEAGDMNVAQQNLACQMIYENRIHNYMFHPETVFFLTTNRASDRSGAGNLVTKLGNRCATATLKPQVDELFKYGVEHGWNSVLLAFLKMHGEERINPSDKREDAPTYFNSFDPTDKFQMVNPVFASSRSYEFLSNYLNYIDEHEPHLDVGTVMSEASTMVSTTVASKFTAFRKIAQEMPDPNEILEGKNPAFPKKQEVLWALTISLASRAKKNQVKHLHAYLDQGPDEFLALGARILFDSRIHEVAGPDFDKLVQGKKLRSMHTAR